MKYIPASISTKIGRTVLHTQKASPTLLFASGVVGVVATTVLACRATLKLDDILEDTQKDLMLARTLVREEYTDKDRKKDIAIIQVRSVTSICKLYAPAIIVGSASIAALAGSHNILSKRNAALTAAYASLEKGFNDYRQRVADEVGDEKEREIRYAAETVKVEDADTGKATKVKVVSAAGASVYARFFDEYSANWKPKAEYNFVFLRAQQNYANDLLQSRGHIFLNEVYDMLGIERSSAGQVVGWVISKTGDNFIDFGIFDGENPRARDFVNGREGSILLDFNVDGVIYDKI